MYSNYRTMRVVQALHFSHSPLVQQPGILSLLLFTLRTLRALNSKTTIAGRFARFARCLRMVLVTNDHLGDLEGNDELGGNDDLGGNDELEDSEDSEDSVALWPIGGGRRLGG
jgi:hypothetical protein